jgi:hypothetical protein
MSWEMAFAKFERLTETHAAASERRAIAGAVFELENIQAAKLAGLLEAVYAPHPRVF